jgi:hypothetical protein
MDRKERRQDIISLPRHRITFLPFQDTCYIQNTIMKQTPNRFTAPSSSDSDSDSDTSERSNHPRTDDLNNVSSLLGSAVAGSPVGNIFRKLGSRPPSPMTREKLQAILRKALDIINEDIDDSELDFGQGAER